MMSVSFKNENKTFIGFANKSLSLLACPLAQYLKFSLRIFSVYIYVTLLLDFVFI